MHILIRKFLFFSKETISDTNKSIINPSFLGQPISLLILFFLLCGCSSQPPLMGTVSNGIYRHHKNFFSCPLTENSIGLSEKTKIIDARRAIKTEDIPMYQRAITDTNNIRIISDEIVPTQVKFNDPSGTIVEFTNSRRRHPLEMELNAYNNRGFTWSFNHYETEHPNGRMMIMLHLIPWYDEKDKYMGSSLRQAYSREELPTLELWVRANLITSENYHHINIRIPARPLLTPKTDAKDLVAVRDDFAANQKLQRHILQGAERWIKKCTFAEKF